MKNDLFEQEVQRRVDERIEKAINDPDFMISVYQKKVELVEKQIEALKPKIDFYDTVVESDNAVGLSEAAKILNFKGIGRNKLADFLRRKKVFQNGGSHHNEPYQEYMDRGYFELTEKLNQCMEDAVIHIVPLVTQRGLDFIRKLYLGEIDA